MRFRSYDGPRKPLQDSRAGCQHHRTIRLRAEWSLHLLLHSDAAPIPVSQECHAGGVPELVWFNQAYAYACTFTVYNGERSDNIEEYALPRP
jgi:hypothetical protein